MTYVLFTIFYFQVAYYSSIGVDYHGLPGGREARPRRDRPVPINRILIKKITPPKKAKDVAGIYEDGKFTDLHYAVKHDLSKEAVPEHGVYENQPTEPLPNLFRETDYVTPDLLQPGALGELLADWKMKGKQTLLAARKAPIKIDKEKSGPELLENEPIVREGVLREVDPNEADVNKPQAGTAKNLHDIWINATDTVSVTKKPINLVEDPSAPSVFESQPIVRENVIRNTDRVEESQFEQGAAKGLVGYWKTVTDEVQLDKKPINVREGKEIVLESQPIVREGVVRESDAQSDLREAMQQNAHAKQVREAYLEAQRLAALHNKRAVQLELATDGGVLENEPSVRTDVVKSDIRMEDFLPSDRHTQKLAQRYVEIAQNNYAGGARGLIEIDRSGGVICENEPAQLAEGIVKGGASGQELNFVEGATRSMVDQWKYKGDAEFKRHLEGKPQWVLEIEQAQEAGVYESQPIVRDGVIREVDQVEHSQAVVPNQFARGMRDMWLNREEHEEEKARRAREGQPQVRPKKKLFDAWIPDAEEGEDELNDMVEENEAPPKKEPEAKAQKSKKGAVQNGKKESPKKDSAKKEPLMNGDAADTEKKTDKKSAKDKTKSDKGKKASK